MPEEKQITQAVTRQRYVLLRRVENWLDIPMVVLGFVWLVLLIVEFTNGLTPFLETIGTVIWVVFGIDFVLRFILAPQKLSFLKKSWLTVLSLMVPALRVFRITRVLRVLRLARVARGLRLFRLLTSLNRGMKALGRTLGRRGFGYVVALTFLVNVGGAAGMYVLEREAANGGFENFWEALWWTSMLMTTLGSDAWPQTAEGRLLCFGLALYAFTVFGYVTATLATFFVGRDAENKQGELAGSASIEALRQEIAALRAELQAHPATAMQHSSTETVAPTEI
jgi:voltage-gated potassium channel